MDTKQIEDTIPKLSRAAECDATGKTMHAKFMGELKIPALEKAFLVNHITSPRNPKVVLKAHTRERKMV